MLFGVTLAVTAHYAPPVHATGAAGFVGTTIAVGRFGEISVFNQLIPPDFWKSRHRSDLWLSWQKTKGNSDVYVQSNTWQPGGSTGWHSHPGHSLIIVTEGEVTAYEGDDRRCRPTVYAKGAGFVDPGGDHVHNIRNEGVIEAKAIAVQLIPADATRRIDVANPGNCPF
jgi:quercetin dioxygenase-like cupin family protein